MVTVSNNATSLHITQKKKIDIFMKFFFLTPYLIKFFDLIFHHRTVSSLVAVGKRNFLSLPETPFVNYEDWQFSNWAMEFH